MQGEIRSGPASVLGTTGFGSWSIMLAAALLGSHPPVCAAGQLHCRHGRPAAAGLPFGPEAA